MDDTHKLLRGVARGEISVDDEKILEDASLTEEQMEMAIDKGVFTADMGSIVSAKLAPSEHHT